MKKLISTKLWTKVLPAAITTMLTASLLSMLPAYALDAPAPGGGGNVTTQSSPSGQGTFKTGPTYTGNNPKSCGGPGSSTVIVSFDLGCQHKGNPILDLTFAIIKLLSDGVGLVIIASLIVAGIQYTSSRGDPQATQKAIKRMQSNVIALLVFFFAYALLNYVIPGQVLQ